MVQSIILAGDVGGTHTRLGLFQASGLEGITPLRTEVFSSQEHRSLQEVVRKFTGGGREEIPKAACFAVAGPVLFGEVRLTNLSWELNERDLSKNLGIEQVRLVNDLEASAFGMLFVDRRDLCVLNPGSPSGRKGNIAVVAPGTGLGEAMLIWDRTSYVPVASEGGHSSFAPTSDEEIELLQYLWQAIGGHVSFERVLSGDGIHAIYTYLKQKGASEPLWLTERLKAGDPNATITEVGISGEEPLTRATLDLYARILGSEAGNLALKCLALGGVLLGGGIAPKIVGVLEKGHFMEGFVEKGRLSEVLAALEVSVVMNTEVGLSGAAHLAGRLLTSRGSPMA